jgi:hypothetical protein
VHEMVSPLDGGVEFDIDDLSSEDEEEFLEGV